MHQLLIPPDGWGIFGSHNLGQPDEEKKGLWEKAIPMGLGFPKEGPKPKRSQQPKRVDQWKRIKISSFAGRVPSARKNLLNGGAFNAKSIQPHGAWGLKRHTFAPNFCRASTWTSPPSHLLPVRILLFLRPASRNGYPHAAGEDTPHRFDSYRSFP